MLASPPPSDALAAPKSHLKSRDRDRDRVRIRATRACQRCSQRKVQCDGAKCGLPCSRCRGDNAADCKFAPSRRGTYPRKRIQGIGPRATSSTSTTSRNNTTVIGTAITATATSPYRSRQSNIDTTAPSFPCDEDYSSLCGSSSSSPANARWDLTEATTVPAPSETSQLSMRSSSLAAMFEDFLDGQGLKHDGLVGNIIFLGDSSPLTFALEELQRGKNPCLHDASSHLTTEVPKTDEGLAAPQRSTHPSHMNPADITYLKAKGAFDFPKGEVLSVLVAAFLDIFCPLYSIVDRDKFEHLYQLQKLPWILLHAVCFIGTTYCDHGVIHRAGFKNRLHARRQFYEKAKILFDLGYETDKIVLLQTVLLLTFWGPQMKSYWNPCSWIGFAVTIAESLGIYKSTSSANLGPDDRSLLRRLWWTLAARDAYCATLLGRPFRINLARSDTEMLSLDDFKRNKNDDQAMPDGQDQVAAVYQVRIAKLSIILRQIVLSRSDPGCDSNTIRTLRGMLSQWQSELPSVVDWRAPSNLANVYAMSLKIIFHHHLIVLHLGDPHSISSTINRGMEHDTPSAKITESAAQTISTSALALMMNSMVSRMPHEVFSGFFIASIVFYRQMKQSQSVMHQLGQAALDNCQMVMYEARERWDAAPWALRIFQFLLSKSGRDDSQAGGNWQGTNTPRKSIFVSADVAGPIFGAMQPDPPSNNDILHSIDFESPTHQDFMRSFDDIVLMPNYFMAAPDDDFSNFQF